MNAISDTNSATQENVVPPRAAREVFATNLIFVEGPKPSEICPYDEILRGCWNVHKKMLAVVQPDYIVCLGYGPGRSAFDVLRRIAIGSLLANPRRREKKAWIEDKPNQNTFKRAEAKFDLDGIILHPTVIGLYHPSWKMTSGLESLLDPIEQDRQVEKKKKLAESSGADRQ
jgi:uracil-DNA glycosylase